MIFKHLDKSVETVKGVGPVLAKDLATLGIVTVRDLLMFFPKRYIDLSSWTEIKDARKGETQTFKVTIKDIGARVSFKSRMALCEAVVADATGILKVTWFNQGYIAQNYKAGDEVVLSGRLEYYQGLQLTNPIIERVSDELLHTGRLVPVYALGDKVPLRKFRSAVKYALSYAKELQEKLPKNIIQKYNLLSLPSTVTQMHFPESMEQLSGAKRRLVFDEVFTEQLAASIRRLEQEKQPAYYIPKNVDLVKKFLSILPYSLTQSQKSSLWDIMQDMARPHAMNRLLEGDVGSGKTIVAATASALVIREGYASVFLAPTEVLVLQHYKNLVALFAEYNPKIAVGVLSNAYCEVAGEKVSREEFTRMVEQYEVHIIIATHALFYHDINLKHMALLVIDEQHRFGVKQRGVLAEVKQKVARGLATKRPHILSMSATPIPRTLAMALYGDLEISVLDQVPKGRLPIKTFIVPESKRLDSYKFIVEELKKGRQAYVITPLVEESAVLEAKSVKQEYERLAGTVFREYAVGLLHGKMKGQEKEVALSAFARGDTRVLVATSVVEIGIDVPNASVIVIEDAERFGLAQLHQLRGRVGRGTEQSYCLLFTASENAASQERLKVFAKTTSGFKLAELDLVQRGYGSLFGEDQSGFTYKYGKFLSLEVIKEARGASQLFLQYHRLSEFPILEKEVSDLLQTIELQA